MPVDGVTVSPAVGGVLVGAFTVTVWVVLSDRPLVSVVVTLSR